jgi:GNAT superfamily N-acetyltransferase
MGLCRRLADFGPPPWRAAAEIAAGERRALDAAFPLPPPGAIVLIAEAPAGSAAGFAYIETAVDYFTRRPHAHLGVLAVTEAAEGRGVGRALLQAAESWARRQGYGVMTLNVFAGNEHARGIYERSGYQLETLHYRKALDQSPP